MNVRPSAQVRFLRAKVTEAEQKLFNWQEREAHAQMTIDYISGDLAKLRKLLANAEKEAQS